MYFYKLLAIMYMNFIVDRKFVILGYTFFHISKSITFATNVFFFLSIVSYFFYFIKLTVYITFITFDYIIIYK